MGWAKYYEDNLSIMNDRHSNFICGEEFDYNSSPIAQKEYYGIQIKLLCPIDAGMKRKLQINGWWFSKTKESWCNKKTKVNIAFANNYKQMYYSRILVAA